MANSLEVLENKDTKEELWMAEIVAWLHDMGKCDDKQIEKQMEPPISNGYDLKVAHMNFVRGYKLKILGEEVSFEDLIKRESATGWLVQVLRHCHGAAHMEKEEAYYLLKQTRKDARSSNPFGYESDPLTNLEERLTKMFENGLPGRSAIKEAFSYPVADTRRPINDVTLWDWGHITAALFKAALAEALLENQDEQDPNKIVKKEPEQIQWQLLSIRFDGLNLLAKASRIPDLLAYKELVEVGLNNVRFLLEKEYPLGTEIYRDEDGSVFIVPDVENLLRWENKHHEKLEDLIKQAFGNATPINKRNEELLRLQGEIVPFIELDEAKRWGRPGRPSEPSSLPISDYLDRRKLFLYSDVDVVVSWWKGSHMEDVCSVCQIRPQGWGANDNEKHYRYKEGKRCPAERNCQTCKALERKVCSICEQRRDDRAEEWISKPDTTIWLDEVADNHGRFALVVGEFDLQPWFDGTMLFYPQAFDQNKLRRAKLKLRKPLSDGVTDILGTFENTEGKGNSYYFTLQPHPENLIPGRTYSIWNRNFQASRKRSTEQHMFFQAMDNNSKEYLSSLIINNYYILSMLKDSNAEMKKAQAPVRLSRVWETTRSFWQNCQDEFSDKQNVGTISQRLYLQAVFEQKTDPNNKLYQFHTYELQVRGVNISVVCMKEGEFFTVDNLLRTAILLKVPIKKRKEGYTAEDYKAAAEYIESLLSEEDLVNIELPTGYGSSNKPLGKLRIKKAETSTTPYTPAIPILTEPRTFMALVPADKALAVVDVIKEKYETEMGKVRNRLPLTVGVVFAGSRTPLPAILDAGRRMLRQPTSNETWKVENVDKSEWPLEITLTLKKDERTIELVVPTIMGDQITEDVWYPYWCLEKDASDDIVRARKFKGIDEKWWVHVSDLHSGDEVAFMPSHFDFELLDTAARRFEVSYKDGRRREDTRFARPYCLEQLKDLKALWDILSEGLYTSQIDTLVSLIETKRQEWKLDRGQENSTFMQIVRDIINNANWQEGKHPKRIDKEKFLCQAAVNGQLADVADLYMHILKEKTKVDQKGEKQ